MKESLIFNEQKCLSAIPLGRKSFGGSFRVRFLSKGMILLIFNILSKFLSHLSLSIKKLLELFVQ